MSAFRFGVVGLVLCGCAASQAEPCATIETAPSAPPPAPVLVTEPPPPARPALAAWRDTAARARLIAFVEAVTDPQSPQFVPPEARMAAFDNDGTLWSEQPLYFQFNFAITRVLELLENNPPWAGKPWARALKKDGPAALAKLDEKALLEIVALSEAGVTTDEYRAAAKKWLASAKEKRFGRLHTELVFEPMVELLGYLRAHGFKTYIVSGGSVQFMRAFAEQVYGIPPEQVIGSAMETEYELTETVGALHTQPKLAFMDDGPGKAVAIDRLLGRRPILVAGNSDGDREMLEYGSTGGGPFLGLLVHHDDEAREWSYDRASKIGRLDKALDEAVARKWLVVSMKDDFARVFAFE